MLQVMLCGAEDTQDVRQQFVSVVESVGGRALHYTSGDVWYTNSATADWTFNSRQTVLQAEICVFVIIRRYGDITWGTELLTALEVGKPFIVMCLDETYDRYLTLWRHLTTLEAIADPAERHLVDALRSIEAEHQLTVVPFALSTFEEVLRRQLSELFRRGVELLELRNQRSVLAIAMGRPESLSHRDLQRLAELAADELEEKGPRKRALRTLAQTGGLTSDDLLPLLESAEQGVQRLAFQELPNLYRPRPPSLDTLREAVAVANRSDDVGISRRLVISLLAMDVGRALEAIGDLALNDEGTRRRLAEVLIEHEEHITQLGLQHLALLLADRCLRGPSGRDWKEACREFQRRLRTDEA